MEKYNLDKIIKENLNKTKFQSKKQFSLPGKYNTGGTYISDRAKATQFGEYKMGGGMFPEYHSYAPPRLKEGGGPDPISFFPEQDPEMMYTDRFNTSLNKRQTKRFAEWAAEESKRQGRDILMDKGAYDVQGFWKSGDYKKTDKDGHGTDTWKKPNHPTFSNQSRYHGVDGFYGGNWNPDGGYQPSKQSADMYGPSYYNRMFAEEPGRIEHLDASRYTSGVNRPSPLFYKNGGGLLSRTVTCSNCGWSWKAVDGGKDVMTCHKCGGMIKMQNGGMIQYGPGGQTTDGCPAGYNKHPLTGECLPNGTALLKQVLTNSNKQKPSEYIRLNNVTDVIGRNNTQILKDNQVGQEIHNRNVATNKRQFLNQGQATTKESEERRRRLTQQAVAGLPNVVYNEQTGTTSAVNPNMTYTGEPANFMGERQQKSVDHIMGALEAAGYLTGAGAGINALRNRLGKQVSTLALTEEEMAQAMAEGIDNAGSYGITPEQYRKMLQDQQFRQQTGKIVRDMKKNPSDQHPINEWFRSSNTREFGDEMRGIMRKLGYEPTNPKDVENFRNFFNQRSGQLFLNDQKPVGYGQTLTNMFSNPMNRYGGSLTAYGPGGQTTDGCGPGFDRHPILGTCIPNRWVAPSSTQAGFTVAEAAEMNKNIGLNAIRQFANQQRPNSTYRYITPTHGQQATVGRSSSDEPWRQRQAAEIRRQEAMKNTELAQSFAGLTPSGDINAGVIGANTFANMTPGIGIIPASARLATFVNSVGPNNQRQGENAYYSPSNSFGENALGALNFAGDIGMLGIGSPLKGAGYNVSEGMPGVYQSGFNPIRGAKKFINKAYNSMDEMFGGSGNDVLFSDIQNNSKPSKVTPQAKVTPQVERTYPFENQAEVVHNNNTYFINKDNPTEIMMQKEGQSTLTHASEADIPKVQEKYSATLPKETTTPATPEPVQQTTTPPQQTAAPAQTPPAPKPLNKNLNYARAHADPNPLASPTEKNTGQAAPAPVTPPKKGVGFGQVVKPILKGVGVLGGIGLGMYGMNKIYSNSTPPTKPFSNSPTNNTVAPSDTNFYGTPQVDTSMNQYADTTTVPVTTDSNINAPLTQEEIRQALDTSGIHRYGGQRMEDGGRPKPNLRLPQFQSYRPSYGVNPYIYNQRPSPNVNVFGAGLQEFGQVAPRFGINAGINMQRVSTPDFSGWQKPNYNVGVSYKFQNGGSISIEGLQNALNNIKI